MGCAGKVEIRRSALENSNQMFMPEGFCDEIRCLEGSGAKPDAIRVFRWANVALQPGKNQIAVFGRAGNRQLKDECERILEADK